MNRDAEGDLTVQQAADLLNVPAPYVARLVKEGSLPASGEGERLRFRAEDVLTFRRLRDAERRHALDELTRLTEEFGGYEHET